MAYSIDPISADCYPGTAVLVNKFDIRDERKLEEVESVLTSARYAEWLSAPQTESFDLDHYRAIHRCIFSDLYHWAGDLRTVELSKKGTRFCPAEQVAQQGEAIFRRLQACRCFRGLPHDEFVEEIVDFYCVTNEWHPFREGNGRTQRAFLTQLVRHAGYDLNWSEVDGDLLMIATMQAAQGVTDLLKRLFHELIQERSID